MCRQYKAIYKKDSKKYLRKQINVTECEKQRWTTAMPSVCLTRHEHRKTNRLAERFSTLCVPSSRRRQEGKGHSLGLRHPCEKLPSSPLLSKPGDLGWGGVGEILSLLNSTFPKLSLLNSTFPNRQRVWVMCFNIPPEQRFRRGATACCKPQKCTGEKIPETPPALKSPKNAPVKSPDPFSCAQTGPKGGISSRSSATGQKLVKQQTSCQVCKAADMPWEANALRRANKTSFEGDSNEKDWISKTGEESWSSLPSILHPLGLFPVLLNKHYCTNQHTKWTITGPVVTLNTTSQRC